MNKTFATEEVEKIITDSLEKAKANFKENEYGAAEVLYDQILRVDPEQLEAIKFLGFIAHKKNDHKKSLEYYYKYRDLNPDDHGMLNNIAAAKGALGDFQEAIDLLLELETHEPDNVDVHNNLGLFYHSIMEYDKALDSYNKALKISPDLCYVHYNMGNLNAAILNEPKAIKCFQKALEIEPRFLSAYWNLASALLLNGDWEEGFKAYESRWQLFENFKVVRAKYDESKLWNGTDSLSGKRILIINEQGTGDVFHFIRYAKNLKEMGAIVLLEVPNPEKHGDQIILMENQEYIDEICIARGSHNAEYDYLLSCTSLPYLLNVKRDDPAYPVPYIFPHGNAEDDAKHWEKYQDDFKIGVCWGGSPTHPNDSHRSCYLTEFKSISEIPNAKLFSLQKDTRRRYWNGIGEIDLAEHAEDIPITDMSYVMNDFNDTAKIINQLDVIVTVDTGIAHLAGAMGKPVYMALSYIPDWRWSLDELHTTKWYPTMKLFRQDRLDNWKFVFNNIVEAIKKDFG